MVSEGGRGALESDVARNYRHFEKSDRNLNSFVIQRKADGSFLQISLQAFGSIEIHDTVIISYSVNFRGKFQQILASPFVYGNSIEKVLDPLCSR